jgi:hypothetical protein
MAAEAKRAVAADGLLFFEAPGLPTVDTEPCMRRGERQLEALRAAQLSAEEETEECESFVRWAEGREERGKKKQKWAKLVKAVTADVPHGAHGWPGVSMQVVDFSPNTGRGVCCMRVRMRERPLKTPPLPGAVARRR